MGNEAEVVRESGLEKRLPLNSNMLLYSNLLPLIRQVARDHGYAVGVHGAMVNDLDLMLMPWVEDIRPVHTCIVAIAKACGGFIPNGGHHQIADKWVVSEQPGVKPHDRLSWTIAFGGSVYLDISVIIPSESPATKRGEEATSNPPAWATPQILAACKPGERLWIERGFPDGFVWRFPAATCIAKGETQWFPSSLAESDFIRDQDECYTIPPPPDKPKPDDAEDVGPCPTCGCPSNFLEKVKELCHRTLERLPETTGSATLAREVLAMMEER